MRRTLIILLPAMLIPLFILGGCDSGKQASSFTEEVFLELTDAEYEGREYDTGGNTAAGEYIAGLYASLGLEPFFEDGYYYEFAYNGGVEKNIAAYRPGTEGGSAVVVCAHFDGKNKEGGEGFMGAYDNASGVAAMLNCAKLCKDAPLKSDIVFLACNVEEYGLKGAYALRDELSERYASVNLINIDCIGYAAYGDDALRVYGRDKPNSLSRAVSEALGIEESGFGYPGDSIAFSEQNIAACTISDANLSEESGFAEPLHSLADTRDKVDCARIERFSEALVAFLLESGDKDFAALNAQSHGETEEGSALQKEADALLATVPAGQGLAYDEAYCCRLTSDGSLALVMGIGQVDTAEKVKYLFPGVEIPERIGAYTLSDVGVNGDCYYGGFRTVWEHNGIQTLTDTLENFDAGTFEEGGKYSFALPAPGTRLKHITLQYKSGGETLILQMSPYESPDLTMLTGYADGADKLGGEFQGYAVGFADGEGADGDCYGAVYAGKNGGYVYLLTVKPQEGAMCMTYRNAANFAELLRKLDLPAILAGVQK